MARFVSVLISDKEEAPHEPESNIDSGNRDMANSTFNMVDFGAISDNALLMIVGAIRRLSVGFRGTSETWLVSDGPV